MVVEETIGVTVSSSDRPIFGNKSNCRYGYGPTDGLHLLGLVHVQYAGKKIIPIQLQVTSVRRQILSKQTRKYPTYQYSTSRLSIKKKRLQSTVRFLRFCKLDIHKPIIIHLD